MVNKKGPIIVTGGSGYIGTAIIENLREDYSVISLDNTVPVRSFHDVTYINFDITSDHDVDIVFKAIKQERGETIQSVIHLAGHYNFNGEESLQYDEVNVKGTTRLLQKLYDDFDVGQFVFASSMLVYAPSLPGVKISEDSPLDQMAWAYPRSKIECERIIEKYHGRIPFVILRIAAVYNDFAYAPSIAQQILRLHEMHLTSFLLPGNKNHRQSTIHIDDLASVVRHLVKKRRELPTEVVVSVAEDETPDFFELQRDISRMIHKKELPLFRIPKSLAKVGAYAISALPGIRQSFIRPWMIRYADANYDLDNRKLKELLNWVPRRSLKETLPKIIQNLLYYPGTWYRVNRIPRPPVASLIRTKIMKETLIH